MHFTDTKGREWDLSFTVGTVTRLAKYYRVDPDKVLQDKVAEIMISGSYVDLCVLFWGLLKDQAKAQGVTEADFQEFSSSDWEDAATCLEEAIVAFTRPGQREAIQATLIKVRDLEQKAQAHAIDKLDDPEVEAKLLSQVDIQFMRNLESPQG